MWTMDAEKLYTERVTMDHRKRYAQFFTPETVARIMARWLLANERLHTVLEPAVGLGVFSRALLEERHGLSIDGFDIDETVLGEARQVLAGKGNVRLSLLDYMKSSWETKYDGVICNPPYFKFHDYDNKQALDEVERHTRRRFSGFTNLYTLFLIKSLTQLSEDGRCAYIVPSEFLNADYGTLVKQWLVDTGMLRHIIVFDFAEKVFDDAITTSCILLCANDRRSERVKFTKISSLAELPVAEQLIDEYPHIRAEGAYCATELDSNIKWRAYYEPRESQNYQHLVPLATYAKVVRGIATGSNAYFTFNATKAAENHISTDYLLPCICHATDVKGNIFRSDDFRELCSKDKNTYLFNAKDTSDKAVTTYIAEGERQGVQHRYLTASRRPWYALEKRPPAPIWVSVFNRTGLRFVRNEAGVANLTTFHCVYMNEGLYTIDADLLFAYLLTDTARKIFSDNAREYGNGLQKFEPNDLNHGKMLDLSMLSEEARDEMLASYRQYTLSGDATHIKSIDSLLRREFAVASS